MGKIMSEQLVPVKKVTEIPLFKISPKSDLVSPKGSEKHSSRNLFGMYLALAIVLTYVTLNIYIILLFMRTVGLHGFFSDSKESVIMEPEYTPNILRIQLKENFTSSIADPSEKHLEKNKADPESQKEWSREDFSNINNSTFSDAEIAYDPNKGIPLPEYENDKQSFEEDPPVDDEIQYESDVNENMHKNLQNIINTIFNNSKGYIPYRVNEKETEGPSYGPEKKNKWFMVIHKFKHAYNSSSHMNKNPYFLKMPFLYQISKRDIKSALKVFDGDKRITQEKKVDGKKNGILSKFLTSGDEKKGVRINVNDSKIPKAPFVKNKSDQTLQIKYKKIDEKKDDRMKNGNLQKSVIGGDQKKIGQINVNVSNITKTTSVNKNANHGQLSQHKKIPEDKKGDGMKNIILSKCVIKENGTKVGRFNANDGKFSKTAMPNKKADQTQLIKRKKINEEK